MGEFPKISIILPCFKVEKYLDRCMNSMVNQTLSDIEFILVDDKSPDETPAKCDEWARKDARVKVVHKQQNEGLGYARNTGLEEVTGEYVAFLDSDDFVDVNMYKALYEYASENDLDAAFCGYKKYYSDNKIREWQEFEERQIFIGRESIDNVLMDMVSPEPSNKSDAKILSSVWKGIYKLETLRKNEIKFVSERDFIAEDIIFHIDFLPCCSKVGFIPETYYYYRANDTSLTQSLKTDRFQKEVIQTKEMERRLLSKGYTQQAFQKRVDRYLLLKLRVCMSQVVKHKSTLGYKKIKQLLHDMVFDEKVITIVRRYPYQALDFKHKLFFVLVKYKMIYVLYMLLKNK